MWQSVWENLFGPPKRKGNNDFVPHEPLKIPIPYIPKVEVYKYRSVIRFKKEDGTDVEIILETDEYIQGDKRKPDKPCVPGPF